MIFQNTDRQATKTFFKDTKCNKRFQYFDYLSDILLLYVQEKCVSCYEYVIEIIASPDLMM